MDLAAESLRAELAPLVDAVRRADYGSAIAGLNGFLAAHPEHEVATGLLAAVYFQLGMHDRARVLYEQLVAKHPANALARFQLGVLRLSDNPREALALWQPLLDVKEEFMAHFHSALAHLQLQDLAAAKPLLDHAAIYMPQSHPLRQQLEHLRSVYVSRTTDGSGYAQ